MIIARSPMRISIGGGGTDLPSYYEQFGGSFISAAIDKYVYVLINQAWDENYVIKYSQLERVSDAKHIRHPIVRCALEQMKQGPNIEITSMADIPAGTGLGSSGSFTTAILKGLHAYNKNLLVSPGDLAEQSCNIEINMLKEPVGKQDQYIAAYGGITCFDIARDGTVTAHPANLSPQTVYTLEDHLGIFFTGYSRTGADFLKDQDQKSKSSDSEMLESLHYTKELGQRITVALQTGDLHKFGELMHEHWERKRLRSKGISNSNIDDLYKIGREAGAVGGKLMGAGGGGFLLFYTEKKQQLREAMAAAGAPELRFRFDFEGSKVIV